MTNQVGTSLFSSQEKKEYALVITRFAQGFARFLTTRFGKDENITIVSDVDARSVNASSNAFVLFLRLHPQASWPPATLVIAQIVFERERAGHGTALLHYLVTIAARYGYSSIGIEQTHDGQGIQNFVRKYGFTGDGKDRNWIARVKELAPRLPAPFTIELHH